MTERTVPEDFPREMRTGSLAGSQPKLLLRKVGDRYAAGLTPDELYERYDAVEHLGVCAAEAAPPAISLL